MRRILFKVRFLGLIGIAVIAGVWPMAAHAQAATAAPSLGAAANFAVLADGTGLTCTGSVVTGPVGVSSSSTAVTSTRCTMQVQVAAVAYANFLTAYDTIGRNLTPCTVLTGTLAGQSLRGGVYCFDAAAALTGTLTLTGNGPWLFEIGTVGTGALSATGFTVVGGSPCNAFWWVRQDVTLISSAFQGTILGGGDITLTDTSLTGRLLAKGAVTMTRSPILGCNAAGVPGQGCENNDKDGGQTGHHVGRHADGDSEGCDSEDSNRGGEDHKASDTAKVETHGSAITKIETKSTTTHKSTVSAVKTTLKSKSDSENKSQSGNG